MKRVTWVRRLLKVEHPIPGETTMKQLEEGHYYVEVKWDKVKIKRLPKKDEAA